MFQKRTDIFPKTPLSSNINGDCKRVIVSYRSPYNQLLENMEFLGVRFTIADFTDFFNMLIVNHVCDNTDRYTWSELWGTFEYMLDAMEHDGTGQVIQNLIDEIEATTRMYFPNLTQFNRHEYILDVEPISPATVMIVCKAV